MNTPPLSHITVDTLEGGFRKNLYFTFSRMEGGEIFHPSIFRARVKITDRDALGHQPLFDPKVPIAAIGSSAATVAERLRNFDAPKSLRAHLQSVADQIEKGAGPDTRRHDAIFED